MMQEISISLHSIDRVKEFVQTLIPFDGEFEVLSGKYVVDAKSILGLFSVNLSQPVLLRIDTSEDQMKQVLAAVQKYKAV